MALFVTVLITSNIASSAKIVDWGVSLFGVRLAFDGGTLLFPVSYIFGRRPHRGLRLQALAARDLDRLRRAGVERAGAGFGSLAAGRGCLAGLRRGRCLSMPSWAG